MQLICRPSYPGNTTTMFYKGRLLRVTRDRTQAAVGTEYTESLTLRYGFVLPPLKSQRLKLYPTTVSWAEIIAFSENSFSRLRRFTRPKSRIALLSILLTSKLPSVSGISPGRLTNCLHSYNNWRWSGSRPKRPLSSIVLLVALTRS